MEAIEKLREYASKVVESPQYIEGETFDLMVFADEIEREIEERYMLLPVDTDGVPIHVGDKLEWCRNTIEVVGVDANSVWFEPVNSDQEWKVVFSKHCRHIKPRTVEDVLVRFLSSCGDDDPHFYDEEIREYADKLRELIGGESE